jgi:hypothetical protein
MKRGNSILVEVDLRMRSPLSRLSSLRFEHPRILRKSLKKRPGWKHCDPPPAEPPEIACREFERLKTLEQVAKAREGKKVRFEVDDDLDGDGIVPMPVVFQDALWTVIETYLTWSRERGDERIDQLTPETFRLWLKDMLLGLLVEERTPWLQRLERFVASSEE